MTIGMKAWVSAEPVSNGYHLALNIAQGNAEPRTELVMFKAMPVSKHPVEKDVEGLIAVIRGTFFIHPEMNLVDDLMHDALGTPLDPRDDLVAYANAISRCLPQIESGVLATMGNHLVSRDTARYFVKFGNVLRPYVRPFVMGDQSALLDAQGRPMSDFARGCLSRIAIP